MTPEEAIELRKSVPALRKRRTEIDREIKELHREGRQNLDLLVEGERIRIHRGRPYWGPYEDSYESLDEKRDARVRQRAVDDYWNVELRGQKPFGFHSSQYGHVRDVLQVTEKEARKIALAWVLDEKLPERGV